MATKKPLVISTTGTEEIATGDTLPVEVLSSDVVAALIAAQVIAATQFGAL